MSTDVVLVDRDDNIVGYREKFEAHHNPVPLHRAVSIVIYSKDRKEMLLQKRSESKPTWPHFWSNVCCTHPRPGESYKDCAERRLFEEMGIKTPVREVFRFIYKARMDKIWGEHEYDVIFVGEYKGKVVADPNEAEDYKWMKVTDLMYDIKENPQIYTPWFKMILSRLH